MEDNKWATLLWMFVGFLTLGPTSIKGIEEIMRTMISKTLFQNSVVVNILEGIQFPMASLQV